MGFLVLVAPKHSLIRGQKMTAASYIRSRAKTPQPLCLQVGQLAHFRDAHYDRAPNAMKSRGLAIKDQVLATNQRF